VFLFLGYRGSADKRMPWGCRPAGLSTPPSFLVPAFARTPFLPFLYAILSLCLSLSSFFCLILVRLSLLQSWFGFVCLFAWWFFFSFFLIFFYLWPSALCVHF
jgi:hypothetical protein